MENKLTAEEFVSAKIREKFNIVKGKTKGLSTYQITAEEALRYCHEFHNIKISELNRVEELFNKLDNKFKEFIDSNHGKLNSGDIQTLALFLIEYKEYINNDSNAFNQDIKDFFSMFKYKYIENLTAENIQVLLAYINNIKKEYIICSAIWYKYLSLKNPEVLKIRGFAPYNIEFGIVFSGWRHPNCLYQMCAITGLKDYEAGESVQGFLTNKNRFVDRIEAAKIAFEAGQIGREIRLLHSEDIY